MDLNLNNCNLFIDDINSLLDPSYFNSYQNSSLYESLFKEHSWQAVIFSTNPIRIDNSTLLKNPDTFTQLAKLINFYNQTLFKLVQYRVNEASFNNDKWNFALDKLKSFLYSRIKEIIDEVPNANIPDAVKEYIDSCISRGIPLDSDIINSYNVPKNLLNNFISNSKRNLNKSNQLNDNHINNK